MTSKKMKGFEPLIAATLLIAIALMTAILVYQWQLGYLEGYSTELEENSNNRLICNRADLSFVNISYDCTNSCNAGVGHILDIKLRNSGDVGIDIEKIYLRSTNGTLYEYPGSSLEIGEIKRITNTSTASCSGISKNIEEVLVITDCSNLFLSIPGEKINWLNC